MALPFYHDFLLLFYPRSHSYLLIHFFIGKYFFFSDLYLGLEFFSSCLSVCTTVNMQNSFSYFFLGYVCPALFSVLALNVHALLCEINAYIAPDGHNVSFFISLIVP